MDASQLRPLGVGEIIDAGIRITRMRFRDLAILVAIVTVPAQVLSFFVTISAPAADTVFSTGSLSPGSTPDPGDTLAQLAATLVTLVIGFVTALLVTAACTEIVSATYLGGHSRWRESLRRALRRFWSLLGANLLIILLAVLGALACIVPGVWLWVAYSVAVPAILVEGIGGPAALPRSFRLVRGRWWPVFAILLVGQLLVLVVQTFVTLPLLPILFVGGDNVVITALVSALSTVISGVVTLPFVAAVTVIIYYDLRVRKEGFDLALMVQQLDVAPPAAEMAPASRPEPGSPDTPRGREPPPGWAPR